MSTVSGWAGAVALGAVVLAPGVSAAAEPPVLSGEYRCEGENPLGGKYHGTVSVTQKADTYRLKWTLPHDEQSGVGILEGDMLSVAWISRKGAGVVVYRLRNNGNTLVGRWAPFLGAGRTYRETLSRKVEPKADPSLVRRDAGSGRPEAASPLPRAGGRGGEAAG